jgi:hypothetical protein
VSRRNQRLRTVGGIDRNRDGPGAIRGADARRNALLRLDRHRERGFVPASVVVGHRLKAKAVRPVLGECEADQPASVPRHEVDRFRGGHLSGDDEVALVLTTFVVDQDEHAPVPRFVDDRLGADQHLGIAALKQLLEPHQRVGGWIPLGRS